MNVRSQTIDDTLVDLASEPAFRLGPVEVTPSLLAMRHDDRTASLEPRVMQVLTVLARRPGAVVSRDELVATCWAGRFVSEDAIQRTVAKLRRHANDDAAAAFAVETVPRVGYRLVLSDGSGARGAGPRRRAWLWGLALSALVVAALAAAFAWLTLASARGPATVQFAGFRALGPGAPPELAASFSETVRDAFGEDNELLLRSRGGDYALQGVIQRAGDKLRYSVRLEEVRSGALIWAVSPELPAAELAASRRMAAAVAEVVRCGLTGAGEHRRRLPSHTLALYLQYCDAFFGVAGSYERGLAAARRAVAETPDFSRGWSAVAYAAAWVNAGAPDVPGNLLTEEVRVAAARAVRLDPKNGEAYDVQTYILPAHAYEAAQRLHDQAVRSHLGGCCELSTMANFLKSVGRLREAYTYARRAYDLHPLNVQANLALAASYDDLGQWDRAEQVYARVAAFTGRPPLAWQAVHASYRNDWSVFQKWAGTAPAELRPALVAASAALASGDPRGIAAARPAMEAAARKRIGFFAVIEILLALGAYDEAFRQLEPFADKGSIAFLFMPRIRALRHDPRYAALLDRAELIRYWRNSGTRPDLCSEADPPAFCAALSPPAASSRP